MPDRQEPRLLKRKARYDENRRLTHKGTWYIKHGSKHIATGCSFADDKEAAIAKEHASLKLHEYNVVRYAKRIIGKSENVESLTEKELSEISQL